MEITVASKITTTTLEALASGFKTLNCEKNTFVLDTAGGAAFSQVVDITNASFIHIQCNKYVSTPTDKPDPRRFNVNYGAVDIGNMSQFQTIDCDGIQALTVTNIVVPASEKAVLTIIKGIHT